MRSVQTPPRELAPGAASPTRPNRIHLPSYEEMSSEQQRVYTAVVQGRRGKMIGPLRAAIHSPILAERWSQLGEYLRYNTVLPERALELAITVTARRWTSQVEWWVHASRASDLGVPPEALDAIRDCAAPTFSDPVDLIVYEFARQIHENGVPDQADYDAVWSLWGEQGIVEMTAVIGYYTMVAITLNTHDIQPPEASSFSLPDVEDGQLIKSLRPGRLSQTDND